MTKFVEVVLTVLFIGLFCLLFTYPLMWMINYVFTQQVLLALFGTPQMVFWKTFWLSWLCTSLFKSVQTSK